MDLAVWIVLALILFSILAVLALGRGREAHVGRYGAHPNPRDRAMPPADDAGHQGSYTSPRDVRPGPGDDEGP
jgi:hypothetical protein